MSATVEFRVADAISVDLEEQQFDLVIVEGVLHHIDLRRGLDSIARVLRPGGHILIVEPVCLFNPIQSFKERTGVGEELSPNEWPLNRKDLELLNSEYRILDRRWFNLT